MFLLSELPSPEMTVGYAKRFPKMQIDTTAACLRLLKVASTIVRDLDEHFTEHGTSQARFLALVVLERESSHELMPVEIARQMGISKKNVARMLVFMENENLVTRSSHETDGRASMIRITKAGGKLLVKVLPGYYQILNQTLKPLNAESKQVLIGVLDLILDGAEAGTPRSSRRSRIVSGEQDR